MSETRERAPQRERLELSITGMTCDGCAAHVRRALAGVDGVVRAEVPSWQAGAARVEAPAGLPAERLEAAVTAAGYGARLEARQPLGANGGAYDLAVIGTGGAGMAAAIRAAELGFRCALVEAGEVGGTCVNVGCVPSKTLLRAAEAAHTAARHPFAGVRTRLEGVDWGRVVAEKDRLVASLRQEKYLDVLEAYAGRIDLVRGRAAFAPGGGLEVDGGPLEARKVVIATGGRPRRPQIPGGDEVSVLDSTTAMSLPEQPASLIVLGGRYVALEQAQLFARLGTRVTVVQRSPRLIPDHEPEVSEALADALTAEGIAVLTGTRAVALRAEGSERVVTVERHGRREDLRAEQVLAALGRQANTGALGLEHAGIVPDAAGGAIGVDAGMATVHPDVYAAGDCTDRPQLVYVAAAAGGIAAENALTGAGRALELAEVPDVIFTDPQVARVGLSEAEARRHGHPVKATTLPLAHVPRAQAARNLRGLVKLVADAETDRLLGAQVLAAEAGETIQTAALAVHAGRRYGFTVADLRAMLFPYLVQTEGLKLAALTFDKDVSQLSCCAG